jgi:type II secretion system protein I
MPFRTPHAAFRTREAFTLLEVILALAVLAVSLAALGEVLRRGEDNSHDARDLTQAQLIAASRFAELTSGALALSPVANVPVPEIVANVPWVYSIETADTQELGIIAVRVTVSQNPAQTAYPLSYSVVRWMPDPLLATTTSTSGSTSTGGSASSGSTSGGAQ